MENGQNSTVFSATLSRETFRRADRKERVKEPMVFGPLRRVKFLVTAPFIVLMLFVINVMTSPGQWWVQWAAFGIGIAWVINFFKLMRDIVVLGGLAAFGAYLFNKNR
jgi:hypothetical protein